MTVRRGETSHRDTLSLKHPGKRLVAHAALAHLVHTLRVLRGFLVQANHLLDVTLAAEENGGAAVAALTASAT